LCNSGFLSLAVYLELLKEGERSVRFLFLILGFLFFGIWIVSFVAFHVAGALVHLLLVIGVIAIIIHFMSNRRTV